MPDSPGDLIIFLGGDHLYQRLFEGHQPVNFVDMHKAVAPGARHPRIDLGDHQPGVSQSGPGNIDGNTQTAIAKFIGWADLNQRNIQPNTLGAK